MKSRWMLSLLVAAGLIVAVAAHAADAAKKAAPAKPAPDAARMAPGGEGPDGPPLAFDDEDEGDDLGPPLGGMHGMGPMHGGPGMGMGMGRGPGGPGGRGCDDGCGMGRGRGMGRGMGMGPGGGPGAGMAHAFAALDLNDTQREKLRTIREREARKGVQARADLQLARMDLHELMRAEKPDPAAINAQIDKLARLQAERRKAQAGAMLEARALLTPEQQKQLRTLHERGPGMGAGGMRHPGAPAPEAGGAKK